MKEYIYSFLASIFVTLVLCSYGLLRSSNLSMLFFQNALGEAAAIVLGLTLLIGPLSRTYPWFSRFLKYRKEIGVMVFIFAFAHAALSYLFVFSIFSAGFWTRYLKLPSILGTFGLIGLFLLFMSSRKFIQTRLGNRLWWQIQYKGVRITGVLVFTHIILVSGVVSLNWLLRNTTSIFPPVALFITYFGLWVLFVRLFEWILPKQNKRIVPITFILNLVLLFGAMIWKLM